MRHTTLWSCTHIPNKYYLINNYLTLRSKVKVSQRLLRYATHRLMVMHPHTKYHWPISNDKNVMVWTRKYYRYLKNNYLTLRSKVKVSRRSLRYATHRLMVMHPQKSYGLDKLRWEEAEEKIRLKQCLPSFEGWSGQASLRRSRSRSGRKNQTKTICLPSFEGWSGQASLRRSGRKNQTKTICLPSFEGWSGQASLRRSGRKNQTKTICVPSFEGWSGQASLRRSGRKNQTKTICVPSFEGETYLIYL